MPVFGRSKNSQFSQQNFEDFVTLRCRLFFKGFKSQTFQGVGEISFDLIQTGYIPHTRLGHLIIDRFAI